MPTTATIIICNATMPLNNTTAQLSNRKPLASADLHCSLIPVKIASTKELIIPKIVTTISGMVQNKHISTFASEEHKNAQMLANPSRSI